MGILTKNDTLDSYALACFGQLKQPPAWKPAPPEIYELKALMCRRDALSSDVLREKNRLEKANATSTSKTVTNSMVNILQTLEKEQQKIEEKISKHICSHPDLKKDMELLTSITSFARTYKALKIAKIMFYPQDV